ncbi:hypothetical protein [Algivirga pacifica]|uniref:DUF3299 domain-containing protein n=1 Tax=Algivirga pacifica TaxID=1162670 RepID=A0ABP9DHK1_9BACT
MTKKLHTLLLLSIFYCINAFAQSNPTPLPITWKDLSKIEWNNYFDELLAMNVEEGNFDESIHQLEGQILEIEGYIIPVDTDANTMVLSQFPYANCFFCSGTVGPETIIRLTMKKDLELLNKKVRVKGKFNLHDKAFDRLYYQLEEAEVTEVIK